ncbi:DUF1273 domain-containing protein [Streptococcus jiangjianxini]|uniref:DUF1273 domain-containing protein n=1 Tax=Streptococcus jiangjianxini TaxID=3161189 RepID=UPI0032EEC509
MTTLLVAGYRSFDLGIFKENDERIAVIKKAIRRDLERFCSEGLKWLIFTGELGFEYWVLEVAKELKEDYDLKLATIFCFANQGDNWNEANQMKLSAFKQVDFVKYSFDAYDNPGQFKQYHQFLLANTDEAYLFYDSDHETNLKYLYHMMRKSDYKVTQLRFDDLNDIAMENE